MATERASAAFLASVQPVVLVGGKSERFGRDKLREPVGNGEVLVQRAIAALRGVFGARVKLVGECEAGIQRMADGAIADAHPGVGPIGGVVSALEQWGGPVFVLAGDMPNITAADVGAVLCAAERALGGSGASEIMAVLAASDRLHPCVGLYLPGAIRTLAAKISQRAYRLSSSLPEKSVVLVSVPDRALANVNHVADLVDHGPMAE